MVRKIDTIVIHHSGNTNTKEKIYDLHVHKNGWDDIGYHYLIAKEGTILACRKEEIMGAHVKGYNATSLGICVIGNFDEYEPTAQQQEALIQLCKEMQKKYPLKEIKGHRDVPGVTKSCPGKKVKINQLIQAVVL